MEQVKELFLKKLSKYAPTKTESAIFDRLKRFGIKVQNDTVKALRIDAVFEGAVSKKLIFKVEDSIKKAYGIDAVDIDCTFENVSFNADIFYDIILTLEKKYSSGYSKGFFEDSHVEWNESESKFIVSLRENVSSEFLYFTSVGDFIKECSLKEYGRAIETDFVGEAAADFISAHEEQMRIDTMKSYAAYEARVAAMPKDEKSKSLFPMDNNGEIEIIDAEKEHVQAGRIVFDISSLNCVFGEMKSTKKLEVTKTDKEGNEVTEEIIKISPSKLSTIKKIEDGKSVRFPCVVFASDGKDTKTGDATNYKLGVTDMECSITVRFTSETPQKLKGKAIIVEGKAQYDKFEEEVVVRAYAIATVKKIPRRDTHPTPRVELHLHTNMSQTDGLCLPDKVISTAEYWNMPAIAVTDHGNAQSYPLIMANSRKSAVKPIYGMEGYLVDDTERAVYDYKNYEGRSLTNDEFVIFDLETTGLSAANCGITEIGAVKYKNGESLEVFETYVNPGMAIPKNITELTGITDEMVKDAPDEKTAVSQFLEFCGDRILVAHNATFDTSFIRRVALQHDLKFTNPYIDTVALSRYINPELTRHKLNLLADYYKLGEFNHHRASDDTKMLAKIFECMCQKFSKMGVRTIGEVLGAMEEKSDPKKLRSYHITLLVKNLTGLKNLYKLISKSYLDYFHRHPLIPKTLLAQHREGILVGSACESGELYTAVLGGRAYGDIMKIADFYDYFEIQPHGNNWFLFDKGELGDDENKAYDKLSDINRQIIKIGEKQNKLVVATGDVHFLEPEDEIYRQIMCFGMKYRDAMRHIPLYLKTTDEMLKDFSYLGKEKAFEVVVTNTRKIADMVERILPIPDGSFSPAVPGSDKELQDICYETAKKMYGDPLPEIVQTRLDRELTSVIKNGYASLYIIARRLVQNSEEHGYLVGSRGSVGSSAVATFSGVSEVNPLPPHYRCEKCHVVEFVEGVGSGYDLPDKACPKCGENMICDGHDIPFETFLGFHGEKAPDIDLNFSGDVQGEAHKYTEVLFGAENIFRAGTVSTIADKTAYGFVKKFLEEQNITLTRAEENRLTAGVAGIKRTTGQHPGGIVVIPKEYEIYDFTPVQHPADDSTSNVITTHFAFEYLHDTLLKLDILGHDVPTEYKMLQDYTGIDVRTVPTNDTNVMKLFTSIEPLGVSPDDIFSSIGTYGMPECGTSYVRQMMEAAKPKCFSDLLQISGLSHGTGIWLGNGEELIKAGTCTISEIIGTRDSIMLYLSNKGVENGLAFKIMESVRKGKGLTPQFEEAMRENNVPEWYIASCKKIKYMFPKAHAAAYMISALRLGWYKVYKPLAFYASHFTVKQSGFDAEIALDKKNLKNLVKTLDSTPNLVAKDKELLAVMQLVLEMYARGIDFLPVDVYKSESFAFVPEDGKIRLPLSSLKGLGENAAKKIREAVSTGAATTVEELKTVAGLSKTLVETLENAGCLKNMPKSAQLSLFDF